MTREEVIAMLKVLKEQALKSCKDMALLDVKTDSFIFVIDEAIKELEQAPCEDAISRQAVIDCFKKWQPYMGTRMWEFEKELKELPSVKPQEPKTEWIPVKFRPLTEKEQEKYPHYCSFADCLMPNEGDEILVTTKYGTVEKDEAGFDEGYYLDSGYDWETDIIAWQPLPEPYKEVQVEDQADG